MEFMTIQDAMKKGEGEVAIRGWVYRERSSNNMAFIIIRDQTNILQCVVPKDEVSEEVWKAAKSATMESSLTAVGTIKKDERAPSGYEVLIKDLKIVGGSDTYPISKDFSTEFLLDKRHLWIRSRKMTAIFKIRSTVTGAIHKFFRQRGYFEFTPPIFTPNACEGGNTLFEVKYFGDKVFLSQSWQLYAEAAIFSLGKIYDMSPTFRAEKHKTSRHLAEFWMAEMEAAWMELDECAHVAIDEIKFIIKEVLENNEEDLKILKRDTTILKKCLETDFPVITYSEAVERLHKMGHEFNWGDDLRTVEEEKLLEGHDTPIVVTRYPKAIMAFYKPVDPKNDKVALCFDMLAPEGYGEMIGGSQRDTNIEALKDALTKEGEPIEKYEWYLDLRRFGSVPHSGYGMGVERIISWICKLDNIKDAIPFPRTMFRKSP